MQLRGYQETMIDKGRALMRQGCKRILFQLATGGGKTAMASHMIGGAAARGLRCHFNVHRKELVDQTGEAFAESAISHGYCASGYPFNPFDLVMVCGVNTLAGRLDRIRSCHLAAWDECHHMAARTYRDIFNHFPAAFHIGLSATPERLDGSGLDDFFDEMVCGPSTADLIRDGYLAPYRYFSWGDPKQRPDLTGVRTSHGEWNRGDLAALMDRPRLIGDVVEHYLQLAPGDKGVVFAVNREHSRHLADAFNGAGVAAAHIDGSMDGRERKRIVDAFRAGDTRIMVNVDLFGEGFNVPDMIYCALARPTKSLTLFLQQCGRALRTSEGKGQAIIADHAGNAFTHGLPDDQRKWTLQGRRARGVRTAAAADASPIHQCPICYQVTYSHVINCPCGHVFAVKDRMPGWEEGQLYQLERVADRAKADAKKARKREEDACTDARSLIALAKARGYKNPAGWATMKLDQRSGKFFGRRFARRANA